MRFSILYGGIFMALGAFMAFGPLWLSAQGLSDERIGQILTLAMVGKIAAGLALPALSDRWGHPAAMLGLLALCAMLGALSSLIWRDPLHLLMLQILIAGCFAGLIPLSDAHGYAASLRLGFSYRRARSIGSFAFLAATLSVGLLMQGLGTDAVIWFAALASLIVAWAGWHAPLLRTTRSERPALIAGLALLKERRFALFLLAASCINASHAIFYAYGSVHWRSLGYSETLIGALWAWGVMAEIFLFWIGRSVMARLGSAHALMLAAVGGAMRWGLMSLDPSALPAFALQTLHAFSFGLMHLSVIGFVSDNAPPKLVGSAQGLVSAVSGGVGMALATWAAAMLYPSFGAASYGFSALLAASGLIAALALSRLRSGHDQLEEMNPSK
ncbi:MAG: MFS transporter [Neomegalonema sp.]|nr:MFS transporter [Neomegalonema sp.]